MKLKYKYFSLTVLLLAAAAAFSAGQDSKGYPIYEQYCLTCHGETGNGDGPAVKVLPAKPGPLKDSSLLEDYNAFTAYLKKNDPISSITRISHYTGKISDQELNKLIYFFMSLKKVPDHMPPRYVNATYSSSCIFCHGYFANGQGVIQNFKKKPYNFRSRKSKILNKAIWTRKLKASQKKIIKMGTKNPHFFRQLSEQESRDLYDTLKDFNNG